MPLSILRCGVLGLLPMLTVGDGNSFYYIKETLPHVDKLFLISKAHLISLYESVGFRVVRKSPVVHGVDDWFEMEYDCLAERE